MNNRGSITESELVRDILADINDVQKPKKNGQQKSFNLRAVYYETLAMGERRRFTVRKYVCANNLREAQSKLYQDILDSCSSALMRHDIISYSVNLGNITSYSKN
jgi:hypothetical protein